MINKLDLSVLIVTWHGDALLSDCLDSIRRIYGENLEVVVVDNGNLASTKDVVSRVANAKYVAATANLGFAGGNNLGLPHCTKKYVLLLNNDTVVREDSFSPMVEYFETHPNVAVVQGKMRLVKLGDVLDTCGVMLTPFGVLYDPFLMCDVAMTAVPTRAVYAAKGAMMMIRRSAVDDVGGILFYDHFHCNHEETDFCHRVWLAGYEVHYVDTPPIDHLQSQTISRMDQERVFAQTFANQIFSFRTTLGFWGRLYILPRLCALNYSIAFCLLLKGRPGMLRACIRALVINWRRRKAMAETRKRISRWRKLSDRELIGRIVARPPLAYYYCALGGRLCDYNRKRRV